MIPEYRYFYQPRAWFFKHRVVCHDARRIYLGDGTSEPVPRSRTVAWCFTEEAARRFAQRANDMACAWVHPGCPE